MDIKILRFHWGCLRLVFMAACFMHVLSSGKFTILLINFKNPDHKVFNGDCCDNVKWCSLNPCDNYFHFCAVMLGSVKQCSLGGLLSTKVLGDDDFRFPGKGQDLGGGLTNPITYSFQDWKGASVVVKVWDDDSGHIIGESHDFVDEYTFVVNNKPAKNKQSSTEISKKLCGKRSCTNVKIEVYCDNNYLIPECTEYCVARDSDVEGHYTCNYDLGRKVCLEGWYDSDSNCTKKKKECTPRNDTAGHYDCNPESGEKMCHSGWMGSNCTLVYVSTSIRLLLTTTTANEHIHTEHVQQSKTKIATTTTTYTTGSPASTVGSTSVSRNRLKTSSANGIQPSATHIEVEASPLKTGKITQSNTITEKLRSRIDITTAVAEKKESTEKTINYQTTNIFTLAVLQTTEISSSSTTVSSSLTTSAHASSVQPTMTRPTRDQGVIINVFPGRKWTNENENVLKNVIKDQLNIYCKKQPASCSIDPKMMLNSSSLFNTTDVLLETRNESTGNGISVTVRVKIPSTLSSISGGILVPSIAVKQVITKSKDEIERQSGLKVSLDPESITSVAMTTAPTVPQTSNPVVIENSSNDSLIPGLDNSWAFVIGVALATLLLLVITLCFTFHVNRRPNKVHPLNTLPQKRTRGLTHKEDPQVLSLTPVQLLKQNKSVEEVQTTDTSLRSRTSSTDLDSLILNPFAPDYTTRHQGAIYI